MRLFMKWTINRHEYRESSYNPDLFIMSLQKILWLRSLITYLTTVLSCTQWPGAYFRLDELSQEVRWYPGHQGHCGNYPQCSDKSQNSGFLRKSIFLILGAPQKLFWPPETLFGLRNLTFGGVIPLKLFDPSNGFGATDVKIALFGHNQPWKSPKPMLRSKSFRSMTPPKVRFLRPNKVLGAQKSYFGPQKTQKIDFLQKLDLYDLAAHSQGLPQYPVTRSHWPF